MTPDSFGVQLRLLRRRAGLSQEKLAELACIDRKTLISLERSGGTLDSLNKVIRVLDVHLVVMPTNRRMPTFDEMVAENLAEDEFARKKQTSSRGKRSQP